MKTRIIVSGYNLKQIDNLNWFQKFVCKFLKIEPAKAYTFDAKVQVEVGSPLRTNDIIYTVSGHKLFASKISDNYFSLLPMEAVLYDKPIIGDEVAIIYSACSEC